MKRIVAIIIALLVVWAAYDYYSFITTEAQIADVPILRTKYEIGPPDPTEMLELVNMEREKVGVTPLKYDANVERAAQLKADDFADRDYYSHIVKGTKYTLTPEMARYIDKSCTASSENIAADRYTSKDMIDVWMASPPHRKAILDEQYQSTGFGVSTDKDADYYSVQKFCVAK